MRTSLVILACLLQLGCAYATQTAYYETGEICARTRSLIWGTGETEQVSNACGDYAYSTEDTGLSDNGRIALDSIAEAARRAAMAAALKGIVPVP